MNKTVKVAIGSAIVLGLSLAISIPAYATPGVSQQYMSCGGSNFPTVQYKVDTTSLVRWGPNGNPDTWYQTTQHNGNKDVYDQDNHFQFGEDTITWGDTSLLQNYAWGCH